MYDRHKQDSLEGAQGLGRTEKTLRCKYLRKQGEMKQFWITGTKRCEIEDVEGNSNNNNHFIK